MRQNVVDCSFEFYMYKVTTYSNSFITLVKGVVSKSYPLIEDIMTYPPKVAF